MPVRVAIDIRHIKDFGVGTYIRNLVQALAAIDHENRYILVGRASDLQQLPLPGPNFDAVSYGRSDAEPIDNITFPLFVHGLRVDLCHIPLNAVPYFMPKPYVVTIHDMATLLFPQVRQDRRQRFLVHRFRRGLLRADRIIAVSNATRRDVEKLLGIPPERIRRVYNALDPRFLASRPADDEVHKLEQRRVLERYQVSYPFLLHTGNIKHHKNVPRVVEGFAVAKPELEKNPAYRGIRLIIIGDEIFQFPSVRRTVIQTHMEQAVRFLGFVPFDTLRVFYESAAAFLFPSLYEGFGLPPLEAMASGTPVITSSVSSLPEVVGDAAMIVNPEIVFDIARGIREVLLNPQTRESLVQKGYEQVRRFSWETAAREVLETYREVAGRRK